MKEASKKGERLVRMTDSPFHRYGARAMAKLLFVTPSFSEAPIGGRAQLSRLYWQCLESILGEDAAMHVLDRSRPTLIGALRGEIDGVTPEARRRLLSRIGEEGISKVLLNGSNLGRMAKAIKRRFPAVEILTLFHNVEARFFLGALRHSKSPRALAVLVANFVAERLAVRYSDRLITLNGRDSDGIGRIYGRRATDILPMAIVDSAGPASDQGPKPYPGDYLLFVGGGFYANRAGILWFAREVAPAIGITTCVVGRGLEDLRSELERGGNVRLIGEVDVLESWYRHAKAVIAPIFDGSGMKTKVAEALMHGKRIAGTSEAFVGYEEVAGRVGWTCDTRNDFIELIRSLEGLELPPFDASLRSLYERHYSSEAAKDYLEAILRFRPLGSTS
jgi:glycosyltransferase involved in cell wall biosynthesis